MSNKSNSIVMVGDMNQMMYRFLGAKPEILGRDIMEFWPSMRTIMLEINYRSSQKIIEACTKLIAHNYDGLGGPYPQHTMQDATPRENAPVGEDVSFKMFNNADEEASYVAESILAYLNDGHASGDVFVLARTRAQLSFLEGAFFRKGIDFVNLCGGSFWSNGHVNKIVSYLKLAIDPSDKDAFKAVYNIASNDMGSGTDWHTNYTNHRWLGRTFLEVVNYSYENLRAAKGYKNNRGYNPFKNGIYDLENFVTTLQDMVMHGASTSSVLQQIWDGCYQKWLKEEGELDIEDVDSSIMENFSAVMAIANQYTDPLDFVDYVNRMIDNAEKAKDKEVSTLVVISTAHRVKGQERDIVFGIGWSDMLLPHAAALVGMPSMGILNLGNVTSVEDERCIAFVIVSRAKNHVHLSGIWQYRNKDLEPSQFIAEMGIEWKDDRQVEDYEETPEPRDSYDTDYAEQLEDYESELRLSAAENAIPF